MKKRLKKKLAKQALVEFKNMERIRAISTPKLQEALWGWLYHQPNHPISLEFWKEFNSK